MPSGISHMLLSRYLPIDGGRDYRYKIMSNTRYFQVGSIAPDLPYGSIADNDFLHNEDRIANLFHFCEENQATRLSPNKLPLAGLKDVKNRKDRGEEKRECDALFWFVTGYASHVIADGVFHPFVMDKVGRYEGGNQAAHRALEMGIDVLLLKHLTAGTGHAIEASYAGMDLTIASFPEESHADMVLKAFSALIKSIYNEDIATSKIKGWINGISRLFTLSTGKWPAWLRQLEKTDPFVFHEIPDLDGREEEYLLLEKPKYWDENFLKRPSVHALNDCLPLYNRLMKEYIDKAYAFVYGDGDELTEADLPAYSLDTGRTVNDPNNITLKPVLWEAA